jgi:hypothetical protein
VPASAGGELHLLRAVVVCAESRAAGCDAGARSNGVGLQIGDRIDLLVNRPAQFLQKLGFVQVLATALLAGCSGIELVSSSGPKNPYVPEPEPDYRQAGAQSVRKLFVVPLDFAGAEISRPRRAHPASPTDWIVCLRLASGPPPRLYAMFLRGREVVAHRAALPIDRCEEGVFELLPPPIEPAAEITTPGR